MKVAVVLAGCGVFDGSEIYETTLTLLHLEKAGAEAVCLAPDVDQHHVINHFTGDVESAEKRNVLTESARVARGKVIDIAKAKAEDFDAVIVPGGFGAAKNLSNMAYADGAQGMQVPEVISSFITTAYMAGVPLGFICITPASVAAIALKGEGLKLTVGNDPDTSAVITAMGHTHIKAGVDEIVVDDNRDVVSTPAYMLAQTISEAESGISKLVTKVMELALQRKMKKAS